MKISLIVAMSSNRVIGIDNRLPWHLSADLKKFKSITMGSPILMGRKTYESIGRPLPGRTNIVITRNPDYRPSGCEVYNDIESAMVSCRNHNEIFVIGGATFYEAMLPIADSLYLTEVRRVFEGDTFFPEIETDHWLETHREDIHDDPDVSFGYSFVKLERIKK
jgi:dihydrofolate reductase